MGQQIDELIVRVKGDVSDLKAKFKKSETIAKTTFAKISKSIKSISAPIGKALGKINNMGGALALTAGAAGLGALIKSSLDSADALAKLSGQLGVNAEFLQEMRFAASQTGLEQKEFDQSLRIFTKNVSSANDGVKTYADEFTKMGIDIRDSNGNLKETEVLFKEVADGMQGLETDTEKAGTAFALFGRAGIKLTNTMKGGSEGLTKYQREARDLGIVISGDLLKNAEDANDKFDIMARVISTQVMTAVVDLAPHLTNLATSMIDAAQGAIQFGKDIGLIDEKNPKKKLQDLKVAVIDLEQELKELEKGEVNIRTGVRVTNKGAIETTKKQIIAAQKEVGDFELASGGDKGKVEAAAQTQAEITAVHKQGAEARAAIRAEQIEKEKEEESKKVEDEIARLEEKNALLTEISYAQNAEQIEANNEKLATLEANQSLSEDVKLKLTAKRIAAERELQDAALGGLATTFGNIMSLTKGQNRELFEISKAAATATAIVQGVLGVQRALGSAPPPLNFISAAAVGTSAAVNVAKIQGTAFAKGTDSVPGTGLKDSELAFLTPGERVVAREPNKDLTNFLKDQGGKSGGVSVSMTNNFTGLSIDSDEAKLQLAEALNDVVRELGAKLIV